MDNKNDLYIKIESQAKDAMSELLSIAMPPPGSLVVVGCSSSEILGGAIGKASSPEAARAVLRGILPELEARELFLAAQCCEHLNRSLILEREAAERHGLELVNARPVPEAGGAFAASAWEAFDEPVAVECVRAVAGLDIGSTLIGMHLRAVAVPVRLSVRAIGEAYVTAARTRAKYIGGPRARYVGEAHEN